MTDTHTVVLRRAAPGDSAAVQELLRSAQLTTAGLDPLLADYIVAQEGDRIVGVIGLEVYGADALLRSAAVAGTRQGSGLGRALVDRIVADGKARGIRALYLLTETAERFFAGLGFEPTTRDDVPAAVKESVEFREACPASATVMRRVLGEG